MSKSVQYNSLTATCSFLAVVGSSLDSSVSVCLSVRLSMPFCYRAIFIGSSCNLHQTFISGNDCGMHNFRSNVKRVKATAVVPYFYHLRSVAPCLFGRFALYLANITHDVKMCRTSFPGQQVKDHGRIGHLNSRSHQSFDVFYVSAPGPVPVWPIRFIRKT